MLFFRDKGQRNNTNGEAAGTRPASAEGADEVVGGSAWLEDARGKGWEEACRGAWPLSLNPPEPGPEWNQETKMESGKAQRSQSLLELQRGGGEKKVGGEGRVGWGVRVGWGWGVSVGWGWVSGRHEDR